MLFNSVEFGVFFIVVFGLYFALRHKHSWQNRLLLVASYIFYGFWDWRFLSLILISTVMDYFCGIKISEANEPERRKKFLFLSVFINLLILGFFKYFGFFTSSMASLLSLFGFSIQPYLLNIILPVGISFYTFQTMSYTIDIYRKQLEPTRNFFDYALFVSFFPQLVAGPIERAKHLLPQVISARELSLEKFYEGCYLIFWGLFLKVFIADNLATIVNPVFAADAPYNGARVLIATYAFTFQIFCDFAGYSNIARGLGKCMGFDIMVNFNLPYFAKNPSEFWQRWHISLSSWIRDYLYIPLGGNRKGARRTHINLLLAMLLGGLWHGAAWTFIIWGAYHALLLQAHRLLKPILDRIHFNNIFTAKMWTVIQMAIFFHLVCLGWLIFRAQSITQAYNMLIAVFTNFQLYGAGLVHTVTRVVFYVGVLLVVEIFQYRRNDLMVIQKGNIWIRALFYCICFYLIIMYGAGGGQEFIYFQF